MDELKEFFETRRAREEDGLQELTEQSIIRITSDISKIIDDQLLKSPNDGPMTKLRSDFLKTLGNQPQALMVLESFHKRNPTNSSITRIYAEALSDNNKLDDAIVVIRSAVLASPNDMLASLSLSKMLIKKDEFTNSEIILSFLRRSFSDGDSHYEARLLFARCNLLYGDLNRGKDEFLQLQRSYISLKDKCFFPVLKVDGTEHRYFGKIISKQPGFGFIATSDLRFNVYFRQDTFKAYEWDSMEIGHMLKYTLGFTFRGAVAINIKCQSGNQMLIPV